MTIFGIQCLDGQTPCVTWTPHVPGFIIKLHLRMKLSQKLLIWWYCFTCSVSPHVCQLIQVFSLFTIINKPLYLFHFNMKRHRFLQRIQISPQSNHLLVPQQYDLNIIIIHIFETSPHELHSSVYFLQTFRISSWSLWEMFDRFLSRSSSGVLMAVATANK